MHKKDSLSQGIISKKHSVDKYLFLVLLVPIFVVSFRLFVQPGVIINGDFPSFEASTHSFERLWLWVDKGSYSGFENLARFPMIGIWALLSLFSVGFDTSTKLMIILGFSLCSFSFYFSFYYLLKNRVRINTPPLKLSVALLIGSIFYTYNVWSFNRIDHYYLWIGYAILPIFFVSLVFSLQRFKLKHIVIASLTSIVASSTPHMVIFYGVILAITFLSFFFYYLGKKKFKALAYSTTTIVCLFFLFVVFNLYWILPYFLSSFSEKSLIGPTYVLNLEIIDVLSRDNDLLNTLRLTADWMNFGVYYEPSPQDSTLHSIWLFSSYLFPALALASFVLWVKKIKYSLILFVFFVIGFVLAMGTNIPFDYFSILFTTPILGTIAWVFRDPDKWSFLIAFSYSFFITLFSVFIFNLFSKKRFKNIIVSSVFIFLIISNVVIFAYPVYNYTMDQRYNPIKLPPDFDNLNDYLSSLSMASSSSSSLSSSSLSSTTDTSKVFFMPYSDTTPFWSLNHSVTGVYQPGIYQLESVLPSNQIFYPTQKNYYNYFTQLIQNNQTKDIGNFIYPFGTSYLIYHNDTISDGDLSFLNKVYNLSDLQHDKKIGFFDVFKLPKNQTPVDANNIDNNIAIVQGLDKLSLLNKIPSYSSTNSSVLFLDQNPSQNIDSLNYFNNIITEPSFLNLIFPFMPDEYFVSPFDYTYEKNPVFFWSRVNAIDSLHGEFHPYLQPIGINNWDLDYGKGIVITQASGAKLDIPIEIGDSYSNNTNNKNDNNDNSGQQYSLFIRYLENFRGGNVKIFIDDKLLDEINTQGTTAADSFVWKKIWSDNLTAGPHKLTIENTNGFNAINALALVPDNQFKKTMNSISDHTKTMNFAYLMDEAVFEFFSDDDSTVVPLSGFNTTVRDDMVAGSRADNQSSDVSIYNGTLHISSNTDSAINRVDSLRLNFETRYKSFDSDNQTINPIKSITLIPTAQKTIYNENYENASNPYDLFGDELTSALANENNPISNITIDNNATISGNNALKIDMKAFSIDDNEDWSYILTDYIPIDENSNLNFESKVNASNVNDFHPLVYYYDSNYTLIGENVLDENVDGSFEKEYNTDIVPPRSTKFIQIAFLFLPNANVNSSFLLDDTKVIEILPNIHINNLETISADNASRYFTEMSTIRSPNDSVNQGNTSTFLTQTKSIPIVNNASYTYQIAIDDIDDDENLDSITSYALFGKSNQALFGPTTSPTSNTFLDSTTSTNVDADSSRSNSTGTAYSLQKNIDIINNGNHVFYFQFYNDANNITTLLEDKQFKVLIDGVEADYQTLYGNDNDNDNGGDTSDSSISSLTPNSDSNANTNNSASIIVSNANLTVGTHTVDLKIPNSNTRLDFALIYSTNNNEKGLNLPFSDQSQSASLSNYTKINPTKHVVSVDNATRPFILSFSETYDPLWTARIVDGGEVDGEGAQQFQKDIANVPLFSIVNGFLINKTGSFDVFIEYVPQTWLYTGLTILTIIVILFAFGALIYQNKIRKSKRRQ